MFRKVSANAPGLSEVGDFPIVRPALKLNLLLKFEVAHNCSAKFVQPGTKVDSDKMLKLRLSSPNFAKPPVS
jgi:hypothetical protein